MQKFMTLTAGYLRSQSPLLRLARKFNRPARHACMRKFKMPRRSSKTPPAAALGRFARRARPGAADLTMLVLPLLLRLGGASLIASSGPLDDRSEWPSRFSDGAAPELKARLDVLFSTARREE